MSRKVVILLVAMAAVVLLIAGMSWLKGGSETAEESSSPDSDISEIIVVPAEMPGGITLDIPAGTLTLRRPQRAALGSSYRFKAQVQLERPLRFINCTGAIPNWNISLEAQTALVSSNVKPFSAIRQPAFDQDHFTYAWDFTPEERIPQYQSHFWLRAIVSGKDQTVENWNILVRDFPMENISFFGMPAVIGVVISGFSLVFGLLFLILLLQKRHQERNKDRPNI